ncbi:unnamed protein product [Toxocara canis]|uniref:DCD domain-containing protein n=1 Tax=Toxocara canis TaxID=6265 RepID=A0A183TXR7_TOXCA|nr:unnamed protein product [Toxocara canis]
MARMATETVGLKVPLCEPFMARVMRVDVDLCRICVSPISASLCRKTLETSLNVLSSTNQTYDRPVDITSGFVYLIVGAESNRGVPFRGVIMKEQPAAHYAARVFDVDSGKVMPVGSKDIVQLPACLRNVPPLVICIATPPAAVDCTSSEYISERSIVQCKINPEDLLMCVEGAYPPVLICEVRKEQDAPVSGLTAVGCQPKIMGTEAVTRDEAKRMIEQRKEALRQGERTIAEGMSKLQKERELFEAAKIKFGGQDDECESVKSVENSNSVLNRGLIVRNRREQELAFMAMQLQIANMSQKVDAIANNSGVCIYPPPSGIQLNNAYGQQQQLSQQQANQCLAGGWGEVSGELLARMQQLQVVHQQRGDWSQTVPSYGSVINAAVPSYENTQVQSYGNAENATVPSISSSTNAAVTPYNCVANAAVPSCGIAANAVVPPCGNVRNSAVPSYDNVANLAGHSYGSVTNTAIPSYGNVANLTAPSYHSVANAQAVSALSAPMSTPATQPSEDAHPSPFTPEFKNGGSLAQNASVPQVVSMFFVSHETQIK